MKDEVRRRVRAAAIIVLLMVALDRLGKYPAVFAIDQYRAFISPRIRSYVTCRFQPTCSLYGRESIRESGLIVGGAKTAWRIARCGPWTPLGTIDPP